MGWNALYELNVAPSSAVVVVCNVLMLWDMICISCGQRSGSGMGVYPCVRGELEVGCVLGMSVGSVMVGCAVCDDDVIVVAL